LELWSVRDESVINPVQHSTAQPAPAAADCGTAQSSALSRELVGVHCRMTQAIPAEVSRAGSSPQSQGQLGRQPTLLAGTTPSQGRLGVQLSSGKCHAVQTKLSLHHLPSVFGAEVPGCGFVLRHLSCVCSGVRCEVSSQHR